MRKCFCMLLLLAMSLCGVGCINPLPGSVDRVASDPAALELLAESARAHGGDERFARVRQIHVQYGDAAWLGRVWVFQPVLVDRGFRQSSRENITYSDAWPRVFQTHTGPEGEKQVLWPAVVLDDASGVGPADTVAMPTFEPPVQRAAAVLYNGQPTGDREMRIQQEEAAAMVCEAYRMFLTAPFYFTQRSGRGGHGDGTMIAVMSKPDEVGGVMCDQVLIELRPGFGKSAVDRVQVAIARDTRLVRRVRFSLDGFAGTRGATADVELADFVEVGGLTMPTRFLEVVTHPLDRPVHRWRALELAVESDSPAEQSEWKR